MYSIYHSFRVYRTAVRKAKQFAYVHAVPSVDIELL